MQWAGSRVLVTGAAGVIGRALVGDLASRGARVFSVDLVSADELGSAVQHVKADLAQGVPSQVHAFDPKVVFHLAATFERTKEPPGYWKKSFKHDVVLSHRLLEELILCSSLKVFVFASSYLVYDPRQYLNVPNVCRLKETDPIMPRNLVGLAKYFTERELDFLQETEGQFRAVSARIFRVYGRGSRDIISRWVRAGLRKEPIEVYGRQNRFDYIFADDVAEGLIRLAESEEAQGAINLGSGVARSINDVVAILRAELNNLQIKDRRSDDPVETSCSDMSLFHQITGGLLGTTLEQGIKEIITYERRRRR